MKLILAQTIPGLFDKPGGGKVSFDDMNLEVIFTVAANGVRILFWLAGVAAVIIMILAGIQYITSSGDPARLAKAKSTIVNAVIGLVLVIFAYAIVTVIVGKLAG